MTSNGKRSYAGLKKKLKKSMLVLVRPNLFGGLVVCFERQFNGLFFTQYLLKAVRVTFLSSPPFPRSLPPVFPPLIPSQSCLPSLIPSSLVSTPPHQSPPLCPSLPLHRKPR